MTLFSNNQQHIVGSIFLNFHAVFRKIWPNNRLAHLPFGWCLPSGKSWIHPWFTILLLSVTTIDFLTKCYFQWGLKILDTSLVYHPFTVCHYNRVFHKQTTLAIMPILTSEALLHGNNKSSDKMLLPVRIELRPLINLWWRRVFDLESEVKQIPRFNHQWG